MKRDTLAAVLLALLAVVALGVAAATLDSAVSLDGGGFGGGDGAAPGPGGDSDQTGVSSSPGGEFAVTPPPICAEGLREPPGLLLFAGIVVGIGALAYRDTNSRFAAITVATALGLPLGMLWWLVSVCRPLGAAFDVAFGAGDGDEGILPEGGGGGSGLGGGDGSVATPEALFAVVVVAALLASLVVLLAAAGDDNADAVGGDGPGDEDDESKPDLGAVGRTAGEAADRIESSDADNEVYRAWRDMTAVLDVDRPESSTPAEFAAAAIDAGVDEEPVDDLTAVFERVRYGGEDATADRERRAIEALRRIEARHGGDE